MSADQIRKSLAESGKVVFYGICFDTDKATIKPESEPTLAEMAKFLKANAATKVFIVGHTDMQGGLERNQKLSQDRAAANDAEAGRAKNRRVEMVLR